MAAGESKLGSWILVVGVILLLVGFYSAARTIINLTLFDKYPTTGVLTINFSGIPPYMQREEDCKYPQLYYNLDGKSTRPSTTEERAVEKQNQENCIRTVTQTRESAKANDISNSVLFLFLGTGIIVVYRFFPKTSA